MLHSSLCLVLVIGALAITRSIYGKNGKGEFYEMLIQQKIRRPVVGPPLVGEFLVEAGGAHAGEDPGILKKGF